jgi:hypothetical protein
MMARQESRRTAELKALRAELVSSSTGSTSVSTTSARR